MLDDILNIGTDKIKTGINAIDANIGEGFNTGIHTFCGPSGCGKTALLLQVAAESTSPVIYLNVEMNSGDIAKRIIARNTETDINSIGKMQKDELGRLQEIASSKVAHIKLVNGKQGYISFDYIKDMANEIIDSQHPETVVIVVDSFTQWVKTAKSNYPTLTNEDIASDLIRKMLDLCDEKNVTFIISVQKADDTRKMNEAVEFASETFINMYWELNGRLDKDGLKKANISIAKNRNGEKVSGRIVPFSGNYQRFQN